MDPEGNRLPFSRVCQNLFKEKSMLIGVNPINDIAEICLMAPARLPGVRSIRTLKQMVQGTDNVIENLGHSGTCLTSAVAPVIIAKTFYPDIVTNITASRPNHLPTYKLTWYEGNIKKGAIFNGNRSRYRNSLES